MKMASTSSQPALSGRKLEEFQALFYPRSLAIVGVSHDRQKTSTMYLEKLIKAGFKGKLYPVNPNGGEIMGLKVYPDLKSIPDSLDYVTLHIPTSSVFDLLDDCAEKQVKIVHLFTGGFGEKDEHGRHLEIEMAAKAQKGGFRIIGPNCMGVYCPASGMPFGYVGLWAEPGSIAFISQSGGHAGRVIEAGLDRGIHFSKIVSYGNGVDLDSTDYLEYLAADPETRAIGVYVEGVREGQRFLRVAKEVSKVKPLVVWKGGSTRTGAEVASSHTGSLAASDAVWAAALMQAGAIRVESFEEMTDTLLAFQDLPPFGGRRVAIVTGLALGIGGGGESVSSADICTSLGLEVPPFSPETRAKLESVIPSVGTILRNPLDPIDVIGFWGTTETLKRIMALVTADSNTDIIIINERLNVFLRFSSRETIEAMNDIFVDIRRSQKKPIVVVSHEGLSEVGKLDIEKRLADAPIPIYPTFERAAKAIFNATHYWRSRAT